MAVASSSLQLDLENALATFLGAALPSAFYSAHATDKIDKSSYIAIIAGLPDWEYFAGKGAVVAVSFQVVTSVADPDPRAANALAHQTTLGQVFDLFSDVNFTDTLAALNVAGAAVGLGFTGWDALSSNHEDGRSEDEKALAPKLNFTFELFLFAV